jgi:hypothetical protein
MTGRRRGLVIAIDEYENPGLRALRSPAADAEQLAAALGDPRIGDFEVEVVRNEPAYEVQARIEDLFAEARADDVLLVHFSGHGLKGEAGDLFFAARNTRPDRLASTAVPADFVQRCMRSSASRSVVLLLDCCYGGAFGQGVAVRAAGDVNVLDSFPTGRLGGGRGRAVITASSAMEYAFEGEHLTPDSRPQPSIFTSALVQGLRTGEADQDEDGWVSLDELYDYVFDRVRSRNPNQTPSRDIEMQGDFYVARSGRRRVRPAPVPPDLLAALDDANPYARLGAVAELRSRLVSDNLPVAAGAYEALTSVAANDTRMVADAASEALAELTITVSPERLDFGTAPVSTPATPLVLTVTGPPLSHAVPALASEPWITITEADAGYAVTVTPPGTGRRAGTVVLRSRRGDVEVPVSVEGVTSAGLEITGGGTGHSTGESTDISTKEESAAADQPRQQREPVRGDRTALGAWLSGAGAALFVIAVLGAGLTDRWPLVHTLAQRAGAWAVATIIVPALVVLLGAVLVVAVPSARGAGQGFLFAGAAAATWLPVVFGGVASYENDLLAGRAPIVAYAGLALLLGGAVIMATRPGLRGTALLRGRVAALVIGSAVAGALALLLDVLSLVANVDSTSANAILPASWWFVVPAGVVPLFALRADSTQFRSAMLAGWAIAGGGVWATSFGVQVGAGVDKTYAWLDVYGLTLALLLVATAIPVGRSRTAHRS